MRTRACAILVMLIVLSGFASAFPVIGRAQEPDHLSPTEEPAAANQAQESNAISEFGCTIDPMKPTNPDEELIAKAQFRCGREMARRAIRTELQQLTESDGEWHTVAKSIVVRPAPTERNQWIAANGEPARCKNVGGTRKFRSVILITDGAGNVTEARSNSEEFGRDCMEEDDAVPFVSLVVGSNSLDDCQSVEEVLTDPAAEFTDPEVLFAQGNVMSCDGFVTSQPVPRADAEWVVAVEGLGGGLASLPQSRQAVGGTEIFDTVALTGDKPRDAADVEVKERKILDTLSPEPENTQIQSRPGSRCPVALCERQRWGSSSQ